MSVRQSSTANVGGIHSTHLSGRDPHTMTGRRSTDLAARRAALTARFDEAEADWAEVVEAVGDRNMDVSANMLRKFQNEIDKAAAKLNAIDAEIAEASVSVPVIS